MNGAVPALLSRLDAVGADPMFDRTAKASRGSRVATGSVVRRFSRTLSLVLWDKGRDGWVTPFFCGGKVDRSETGRRGRVGASASPVVATAIGGMDRFPLWFTGIPPTWTFCSTTSRRSLGRPSIAFAVASYSLAICSTLVGPSEFLLLPHPRAARRAFELTRCLSVDPPFADGGAAADVLTIAGESELERLNVSNGNANGEKGMLASLGGGEGGNSRANGANTDDTADTGRAGEAVPGQGGCDSSMVSAEPVEDFCVRSNLVRRDTFLGRPSNSREAPCVGGLGNGRP